MAKVKALKSFEFEGEIKNPWNSEQFDIPDSRVTQFLALGLVAVAPDGQAAALASEFAVENAPRRGRKPSPKLE
ncbi:hypothetical protein [Pantoea sp. 18069]|uniref:hypothetical protein n=1 Tax=Pantoea sp. 18069 TaxID=2681415 RepID=UPI001358D390|nr:hypothetical protein [Pantoea sp. 18069]